MSQVTVQKFKYTTATPLRTRNTSLKNITFLTLFTLWILRFFSFGVKSCLLLWLRRILIIMMLLIFLLWQSCGCSFDGDAASKFNHCVFLCPSLKYRVFWGAPSCPLRPMMPSNWGRSSCGVISWSPSSPWTQDARLWNGCMPRSRMQSGDICWAKNRERG